jgi:hypothetical protein
MKLNPTKVSFTHPTQFTDGTPFGAADYAGTEFAVREVGSANWVPTVAVPVSFGDGTGEVPLSQLDLPPVVELELSARTVAANGSVSDWAASSESFKFDVRVPNSPLALSVA